MTKERVLKKLRALAGELEAAKEPGAKKVAQALRGLATAVDKDLEFMICIDQVGTLDPASYEEIVKRVTDPRPASPFTRDLLKNAQSRRPPR